MFKKINRFKIFLALIIFAILIYGGINIINDEQQLSPQNSDVYLSSPTIPLTNNSTEEQIPSSYLIQNFPFQSQAPLSNWDHLHDEACEEASVILVNSFLNRENLTAEKMDQEILKMVDWEMVNFKEHRDLTTKETLEMAKAFYNLNGKVKKDGNLSKLKEEIANNHPVIIPTAGRLLGNPNFRSPGPVYHMVVAIDYNQKEIIVQDVGTRNGKLYKYNAQVFLNAWHDWTGTAENIENGPKNYIVF